MEFRSQLGKAKGLGSTKSGTKQYIMQRVTAIALLPLTTWFVISLISMLHAKDTEMSWFITSPFNLTASILFILAFLYHGFLGLKVIIEDYIHCKLLKYSTLIGLYFLCFISLVAGIVTIVGMHIVLIVKLFG